MNKIVDVFSYSLYPNPPASPSFLVFLHPELTTAALYAPTGK